MYTVCDKNVFKKHYQKSATLPEYDTAKKPRVVYQNTSAIENRTV